MPSAHSLYLKLMFSIQMGPKMPKPHSGFSKNIKSFYTKFHSVQQNKVYSHSSYLLTYIVSDSLYSVFILKNIKTSTINSNHPVIQQLFFKLQSIIRKRTSPIYITHIGTHSCLPSPMTRVMNKLINLFLLLLPKNNMLYYTIMLAPYTKYRKFHTATKEIINNCSTFKPLHLQPITQGINFRRLQPNK